MCLWWDWGAGPGRAGEGEFLELCSCFAKCAILLSFRERKWDFLPQSPAEPFIFFKHFVIHPSSRTSLTPGCLLSDWDLPRQIKREKHSGTEEDYSKPSSGFPGWQDRQIPLLLNCFHHDLPLHSLTGPLTGIVLSPAVLPCCCAPCWLSHCGRSRSVPFPVLTEVLSTLNYPPWKQ